MRAGRRSLARRPSIHTERPLHLVVAEGTKTEPLYFSALRERRSLKNINIRSADKPDPVSVVQSALRFRNERSVDETKDDFDRVWVLLDVEHVHCTSHLEDALRLARNEGLSVALSCPSFEYWLLLHWVCERPGLENSKQVERMLKKHDPSFRKNSIDFRKYENRVAEALSNAQKIASEYVRDKGELNPLIDRPSTEVHLLVAALLCEER